MKLRTEGGAKERPSQTPQSAHHPHKSHDEHRQCNPRRGIHFAVLLGPDNSHTTPVEIPLFDPKLFVVAVYGWWSPTKTMTANNLKHSKPDLPPKTWTSTPQLFVFGKLDCTVLWALVMCLSFACLQDVMP